MKKYKHMSNAYVVPVKKFITKRRKIGPWFPLNSVIFFVNFLVPPSLYYIYKVFMISLSNACYVDAIGLLLSGWSFCEGS